MKAIVVPASIRIKGYVKSQERPTAYTVYGLLKSIMKRKLMDAGILKPICFPIKDATGFSITRCLEPSPNWSICAKAKWWLTPWAHIAGVQPLQWKHMAQLGLNQAEAMALFQLLYGIPKVRMRIIEEPEWQLIEYTQGTRDDIDTLKVGNPHDVKLWKANGEYKIELYYRPFPADVSAVPVEADEVVNYSTLDLGSPSYNDVIAELLKRFAEEMQGVREVESTLGGRKFNEIEIEVGEPQIEEIKEKTVRVLGLEPIARKLKCSYAEESGRLFEEAVKGVGYKRYGSFA